MPLSDLFSAVGQEIAGLSPMAIAATDTPILKKGKQKKTKKKQKKTKSVKNFQRLGSGLRNLSSKTSLPVLVLLISWI